jgi:predicted lipoprotein with Yx(FWY)xxD motif
MTSLLRRAVTSRPGRPAGLLFALGAAGALAAACGSGSSGGGSNSGPTSGGYGAAQPPASTAPAASGARLRTGPTSLGAVLVGADGRTLYLFEKDTGTTSSCDGACATAWPPVTSSAPPMAGPAAQSQLLGTSRRSDGSMQITYAGHPLYTFAGDRAPGDVRGEGLKNFGGGWYVVQANGQKIDKD